MIYTGAHAVPPTLELTRTKLLLLLLLLLLPPTHGLHPAALRLVVLAAVGVGELVAGVVALAEVVQRPQHASLQRQPSRRQGERHASWLTPIGPFF